MQISIYKKLKIKEKNEILIAKFRKNMKYAKLNNETFNIREVEKGIEISGNLTEQELIEQGYKPLCEVEQTEGTDFFVYREYDTCFVQVWKKEGEKIEENEIWTSDSGVMPKFSDLQRLQKDVAMVNENINTLKLSNNEALEVKEFYPIWSADSVKVKQGERYRYNDLLWEVIQDHTTQELWKPGIDTASLWKVVDVEHSGTQEDPIPYNPPMEIFKNKYYTQNNILYKCIRDSEISLSHDLSTLVDIYVNIV